jgi:hypothetical protein
MNTCETPLEVLILKEIRKRPLKWFGGAGCKSGGVVGTFVYHDTMRPSPTDNNILSDFCLLVKYF